MAGRLWRLIRQWLARLRWPLAGLAALLVVLACVLVIPQSLVRWELGAQARTLTAADKVKAINDIRATLLQGIGGAVLLLGAYFTYRQLQTSRGQLEIASQQAQATAEQAREQLAIAQQGQVTERFTHAIDQLGHAELDVRLGGIYALERIAKDSLYDKVTIGEVLTAYIRGHAPWPPRLEGQPPSDMPIREVPFLRLRAPDVQAALTVLGRGGFMPPDPLTPPLDLANTDLRRAYLSIMSALQMARLDGADLRGADFVNVSLYRATLNRANLREARLLGAILAGATLDGADLQDANLSGALVEGATLDGANLQNAVLSNANLIGATLDHANLQGAHLDGAGFQQASLVGAKLQGASFAGENLYDAHLYGAQLQNAQADSKTTWPKDFDPDAAGVVLIDRRANAENGRES